MSDSRKIHGVQPAAGLQTIPANPLDTSHCEQVMRLDIQIGSDTAVDGKRKQFVFNPWANEYRILHDGKELEAGQALEELLDAYNEL